MAKNDDKERGLSVSILQTFLFSSTCVIRHTHHFFKQKIFLTYLYQEDNLGRCTYKTQQWPQD